MVIGNGGPQWGHAIICCFAVQADTRGVQYTEWTNHALGGSPYCWTPTATRCLHGMAMLPKQVLEGHDMPA